MSDYLFVPVSVDSLEWTSHWLGDRRCDLLGVSLAQDPETRPRVRILAMESKSESGQVPLRIDADTEPFRRAVSQVRDTLDAMEEVLCHDAGTSLVSDLRLAALVEYLTSEVLARITPIKTGETWKVQAVKALTGLSKRSLPCGEDVDLQGLVVLTQPNVSVETSQQILDVPGKRSNWRVTLVHCGVTLLREVFEGTAGEMLRAVGIGQPTGAPGLPEPEATHRYDVSRVPARKVAEAQPNPHPEPTDLSEQLRQLEAACRLRDFKIGSLDADKVAQGPTLTAVSVELAAGESIKPIQAVTRDIARELGVEAVTVENDPQRPYHVRFLLPRRDREFPRLPGDKAPYVDQVLKQYLCLWLGETVIGQKYRTAVSEWPHLLVAGTTGSGKTTLLKSVLKQLDQFAVGELEMVIVDGKGEYDYVDLVRTEMLAAHFPEVQLGYQHAIPVLEWVVEGEVPQRRKALSSFFKAFPQAPRSPKVALVDAVHGGRDFPFRPLVIVIDEFAEIMGASKNDATQFEDLVQRVVQTGRSALVHLVLATQRPDANVLKGAIKVNLPSRVALALPSHHDSMTVLNQPGAEELLGKGDMLFDGGSSVLERLQGYSV